MLLLQRRVDLCEGALVSWFLSLDYAIGFQIWKVFLYFLKLLGGDFQLNIVFGGTKGFVNRVAFVDGLVYLLLLPSHLNLQRANLSL